MNITHLSLQRLTPPPRAVNYLMQRHRRTLLGIGLLLGIASIALAAIAPDVANTRHNLSATNLIPDNTPAGSSFGPTVKATSQTQLCVFCHTPHGATTKDADNITTVTTPLWNRKLSGATYSFYSSASLDATDAPVSGGQPGAGSKLCLSCHDGTIAIGTIGVLNNTTGNIAMQGTAGAMPDGTGGKMPNGAGANTGFTRNIGINLSNDHPISFTYDATLATADGELNTPGATGVAVFNRVSGQAKPQFPLLGNKMECITCHDPHLNDVSLNNKFLRGNRFQKVTPQTNNDGLTPYDKDKDIICLACHNKPTWATSTHANQTASAERYKGNAAGIDPAANLRDFPLDIEVWQAACANCHDMHTVPGARRLLRQGTNAGYADSVGKSAIEQTCNQCHASAAGRVLVAEPTDQVPNIRNDFFNLTFRMPIVDAEQGPVGSGNTTEVHDIGGSGGKGKDFVETPTLLGGLANRHAECTDCHQPHRVTRTELFNGDPNITAPSGTHNHTGTGVVGGSMHTNLASGALRGGFGVEPVYGFTNFYAQPTSFEVKRGHVSTGESDAVTSPYLTREYQVCAKCHSNYAFGSLVGTIANPTNIPELGRTGGTPDGTNGMKFYTNIFREIQAPVGHQGKPVSTTSRSGAFNPALDPSPYTAGYTTTASPGLPVDFVTKNHRSWHPVMGPTGRDSTARYADKENWLAPWTNDVGSLTMYCTDCHGSNTAAGKSHQAATDGAAEGPHGSNNIFILKGWWDSCTGSSGIALCMTSSSTTTVPQNTGTAARTNMDTTQDLCFKCHSYDNYATNAGANISSGFSSSSYAVLPNNLHAWHAANVGRIRCMWCHVAVPHGWKNKAFLVNLNDVGPEANCRQEDADDLPVGYKCTVGQSIPSGTQMRNGPLPQPHGSVDPDYWKSRGYSNPPYYRNALLKIRFFATSGAWSSSNCGSAGTPGNGVPGGCFGWMTTSSEGCGGPP